MKATDLNLLVHFDALMSCKSVSQAGEAMGISQPAMSSALSRLRYLFGDPLLERDGNKWTPTARAQELHRTFQPLLHAWQRSTSPESAFDPATHAHTFNLYASDYLQYTVAARALHRIKAEAPNVLMRFLPPKVSGALDMLSGNYVELYIGHYPDPPDSLRARFLFEETSVCLVRAGHPALRGEWNLDTYLQYEHMDASGYAGYFNAQVDAALQALNLRRTTGALLSSYLATPFALAGTDMIAMLPLSVAQGLAAASQTVMLPAPLRLPPLSISLYWHERYQNDMAHGWLRQCIGRVFDGLPPA
jgi:DNA-binding transcriptional LysR family regulator